MGIDALISETLKNNPTKSKNFIKTHNYLIKIVFQFVNDFRLTTRPGASV